MLQPLLIDGRWTAATEPSGHFHAFDPSCRQELVERAFPISGWADLDSMLDAARHAAIALREVSASARADFLDAYADGIEAEAEALVTTAHQETGLPRSPRLAEVELPRTTSQLRQAAAAVREGNWQRPTIDSRANIRSLFGPLGGAVLVLGPNNFPFAFNGISGGDFAAAIAAGNPVIAKAHPAHPATSALLARIAGEAVVASGLPGGTVQMFFHTENALGLRLVSDPRLSALAFTGSRAGGMALKAAADAAGKPAYLEMSSVNPVFLLPGALRERGEAIAVELQTSCTLGVGQFCTKPGLVALVSDATTQGFLELLQQRMSSVPPGVLLTPTSPQAIAAVVDRLRAAGAELLCGGHVAEDAAGFAFQPTLLRVDGSRFIADPEALQSEAFGPVCLVVVAESAEALQRIAGCVEGNLTASLYTHSEGDDDALHDCIAPVLRPKVGRLLNDKMPTGVAVSPGMNHGGPFPATGHPGFTAVGMPAAIHRFAALHCYDNVREARLPAALRDRNPDGALLRLVDGAWTIADVVR
jgi:NADP-dependent aldehyde dehydrogenase